MSLDMPMAWIAAAALAWVLACLAALLRLPEGVGRAALALGCAFGIAAAVIGLPGGTAELATGTCAVCGGVAEGGYAGGSGLEGVLPVDLWLPGCPPNPAAMIEAFLMFLDRAPQRMKGGRIVG